MSSAPHTHVRLAIIGGGPAGLMAAETARAAGIEVDVFEGKGSVGRKFLIAGKGGMNLTHGEPKPDFVQRYGSRAKEVSQWLDTFDADALREWARGLGVETFVGSSGRVFPSDLKAAPLLRGWVHRLRESGVRFHVHHRWLGWNTDGTLRMDTPEGERMIRADAVVLALGGGSWPQLGSDGTWQPWLIERGVPVAPLVPSNCGFDIGWTDHLASRFAGAPLKPVVIHLADAHGREHARQGECVITATGIEGSLIYAFSGLLRDAVAAHGSTTVTLDLAPDRTLDRLRADLAKPRGSRSMSEHLRRQTGLAGVKAALLHEVLDRNQFHDPEALARTIKRLPLVLKQPRPIEEAISSGGGVRLEALDGHQMLADLPGVFCAGEMLDWEAPTGGYLLTACFASGRLAGLGAARWIQRLRADAPA
ncbi:TIGR03862 family flavoprotein [Dyella jiangningensis]|uniref:Aminoacetone oxidase family FAD-binding enzyme n=1 Tax=Dyella jiangningensis TaxID=1379159 RepID=A0A328P7E9_9GAMM|nr:TIGR03862 family flavoprotein [Dyella jiangningensis]RAO77560.1 aminoacetone oxidase family FAD-binding enzyme [Dyella jiangningensis]